VKRSTVVEVKAPTWPHRDCAGVLADDVPIRTATIDATVVRDFAESHRRRHALAQELFTAHRAGKIELAMAPQGTRLDVQGPLAQLVRGVLADQQVPMLPQLSYVSQVTFLGADLYLGFVVEGFGEAWQATLSDWRSHESRPADGAGSPDRFHVETHVKTRRDVVITDDRPLRVMCRRLSEDFGYPIVTMSLADYVGRLPNAF
jgi:hypothetical protein